MQYINREGDGYRETVDEFETRSEAFENLREYMLSDPSARYWMSTRCCKAWKLDSET